jgi:hypothetical protein
MMTNANNRDARAVGLEFTGRSARDAKRRALNFWYQNRDRLGLSLSDFFADCRVHSDPGLTRIVYAPGGNRAA